MSAVATRPPIDTPVHALGRVILNAVSAVGDLTLFALALARGLVAGAPRRDVLLPAMYQIGVLSVPVVLITGAFIGMVLAVQGFDQLRMMHMESRLGSVINVSLVKELGPVLAAVMLAGRVGCAIAAELGTMRVTEQIDALRALGADPIRYLVVPRFLACVLLIPTLTVLGDATGMLGGGIFATQVLGIDDFYFWHHTFRFITAFDFLSGLFKSVFFGGTIAVVACHRGFHCGAGAEGVGRAATETFVLSFVLILALDFMLGILIGTTYRLIWPAPITIA
ncbi:MAG: ABC transporter permease [Planctomycetota bacterium]|nr:ABC transporter permease [Planctomycetaceae bacterium]MDQ3329681.1 ABC transporter permease [Planctomycetota bacterium]